MEQLDGKVVVVTGAASGIGRSLARKFAAQGSKLVLGDIEAAPLETAADELRGAGAEVVPVPTDVSRYEQVESLRDRALDAFGAVHVVCNNAGVGSGGQLWEVDLDDWRWVLGVNLWGVVHGVKAFVPLFVDQGEGHVVNTASMAGVTSPPFMGPYNVSKHGVVTLSETLAVELAMAAPNVGVTAVCPGWVKTRIDESSRNRPGGPNEPEPGAEATHAATRDIIAGLIAGGIEADVVADLVVDAVRSKRFYVFTAPEMLSGITERTDRMVGGQNPATAMELFQGA